MAHQNLWSKMIVSSWLYCRVDGSIVIVGL